MANPVVEALTPFIWGAGGAKKTPEEIARDREVAADILMRAGNTSPVGHWTQGAARVVDALGGVLKERRANAAGEENAAYNSDILNSLLGGGSSASSSVPMTSAAGEVAATSPAPAPVDLTGNEVYSQFIDTVKGGVKNPYALAAIAATGKAESGFSPGNVNRTWSDPSQSGKPGTAGGIMSWRGPRYDALAATGDLSPAGQAKFFLQEDPQLIAALNNAKSVEEAQQLMNKAWAFAGYDQPGGESARRLSYAQSLLPSFQGSGEVAAATPQAAIEAVAPASGYVDPRVSAPNAEPAFDAGRFADPISLTEMPPSQADLPMALSQQRQSAGQAAIERQAPPLPAPVEVAPAPAVAEAPQQQIAQALTAPAAAPAASGINPAILQALSDPRATPQTQRIAAMLLQQEQQKQQMAEEQRLQASDPLRQIQLQREQLELDQMRQPKQQPLINAGNGAVYDPNTKAWIQAPGGGQEFRQATPEEAQKYGSAAGQFGPDGKFYPINPPQGTALSVGPNGEITFNQGAGVKPLTEAQSKDTLYATRATNALPLVDKYESELLSLSGNLAEGIPLNLGNYAQSEQYQVARDAGRDFLATILRKDTGAAITSNEEAIYGKMFLPQPGDKPAAIQAKRQRRALAVEAIKAGMPTAAIENMAKALDSVPASTGVAIGGEVPVDVPNVKVRRTK